MSAAPDGSDGPGGAQVGVFSGAPEDEAGRSWRIRVLTGLGGVALLLVLFVGVANGLARPAPPTTYRDDPASFSVLYAALDGLGYPVQRFLQTYGRLPDPAGHVLAILDPLPQRWLDGQGVPDDPAQRRALEEWIEAGGRVLLAWPGRVVVEVLGGPVRLPFEGPEGVEVPGAWSAASDPVPEPRWADRVASPDRRALVWTDPERDPELSAPAPLEAETRAFVPHLFHFDAGASTSGRSSGIRTFSSSLASASGTEVVATFDEEPVAVRVERGAGRAVVLSTPLWMTNYALGRLDAGPFAVGLLDRLSDGGRRTILFDETAHGYFASRGVLWWVRSNGLVPLLVLAFVVVVVVAWRGAVRIGPPEAESAPERRGIEEYIVQLAGMHRRAGRERTAPALRRLLETLAETRSSRAVADELGRLADAADHPADGAAPDEEALLATVREADRILAASPDRGRGKPFPPPKKR